MKNNYHNLKQAYSLPEVLLGIVIFAIILTAGFQAYSSVLLGKVKLIETVDIQKEAFYFSEKFFEKIKKGGTIDYEEYFNRRVVGTALSNGHYSIPTGFGNFGKGGNVGTNTYGDGFYYCRSGVGVAQKMAGSGCFDNNTLNSVNNQLGEPHRYGQYTFQFIDYNSNFDADSGNPGDEDGNGIVKGDQDDEYLGEGPTSFTGAEMKEIYLISADNKDRTIIRWKIQQDSESPVIDCDLATGSGSCQSTIEILELEGRDWGTDHIDSSSDGDGSEYDGIIDTWLINNNYSGGANVVAGSNVDNYRQPIFGDKINVEDVKFFIYPNKDLELAWKEPIGGSNIAPYIRVQMTLSPSYKAKKGLKGKVPSVKINTTVSLTDIYSR